MKRGGPIARRTPMSPGGSVLRRGALLRQSEISRKAATPKPVKRDPAEAKARTVVRARSEGRCEVCGRAPASNWHHRQNRSGGGRWDAANGLAVCGTGSTGCHGHITTNPRVAREQGWSVPSYADPARTQVWIARRGFVLLNNVGDYITDEDTAA